MKVCDVVLNSVWYDPRVIKQIETYRNNANEVFIVGLNDKRYNEEEIYKIGGEPVIVPSASINNYKCNRLMSFVNLIKDLRRVTSAIVSTGAQIIHANDLNALVPAYYASRKIRAQVIYDTHEIFLENNSIYASRFKRMFWGHFENKIIRKVAKVVCVSNAAADYLANKYKIEKPMVVTHGISKERIKEPKLDFGNKLEVINHGLFYEGRGYELMIQAAAVSKNPMIHFKLRGFGKNEQKLRKMIDDQRLTNVEIVPPVKTYELVEAAASSSVGIAITVPYCLNFKLSVSNKLFEYAAAGLPVIMSDIPEHRYLNEEYHFGLILDALTPECLNETLDKLYNDKELYRKLAENAYKMSINLNWDTDFQRLMTFEQQILDS